MGLGENRAVKRVPKENYDFYREAAVLKNLRHPGIPIIYDLEEDSDYYYLIEEYLDGESLSALIEREGLLAKADIISFGIELCQIISYLHLFKPNPILYLDLQPNNILICQGTLKLIDFDQAVTVSHAAKLCERFGTVGCAAPEQYTSEPLDVRTDIYAIGALLYYMGTGHLPDLEAGEDAKFRAQETAALGKGLTAVIGRCLRWRREERCQSAAEVLKELLDLKEGVFTNQQIPLLKAAVVGSSHGMGATHVSLSISSYLTGRGINCLYQEKNTSGTVRKMARFFEAAPDSHGVYHMEGWSIMPEYGQCVVLEPTAYEAIVEDHGTALQAVLEGDYDLVLLVCGIRWWEMEDTFDAVRSLAQIKNLRIILNHISPDTRVILPGDIAALQFYRMPYCPKLHEVNQMQPFWEAVLKGTKGGQAVHQLAAGRDPAAGRRTELWELFRKYADRLTGKRTH